jgi:putative transposase
MSICTERPLVIEECEDEGHIGIDMGMVNFATSSDGTVIAPLNSLKKKEKKKLIKIQRALARKKEKLEKQALNQEVVKIHFEKS